MSLCASQFCRHFVAGKFSRAPRCWFKRKWLFQWISTYLVLGLTLRSSAGAAEPPAYLGAHSQQTRRNELKVIQLFFTWIAVQERFQAIPSPDEMVLSPAQVHLDLRYRIYSISLGVMLGLRSGCGSWSKNSKTWWSAYIFWETQLRWGRVGKACASMHQLRSWTRARGSSFFLEQVYHQYTLFSDTNEGYNRMPSIKTLMVNCEADPQRCCVR